jgi:hypothetical protein
MDSTLDYDAMVRWDTWTRECNVVDRCTVREAVQRQQESAMDKGRKYKDDFEAFEDFKRIHWAWIE